MRTTVTLDPDVDALIRERMRDRGLSFEQALNEAVREGLAAEVEPEPFETPAFDLGEARVSVVHALEVAARLEDDELLRKRALGT